MRSCLLLSRLYALGTTLLGVADLSDRGVGARTVQLTHQEASRVLRQAVEDGLIPSNPAARVKTPTTERRAIRTLSVEEVEALADVFDPRYRCWCS